MPVDRSGQCAVLLDTHALLSWRAGGDRLSGTASALLDEVEVLLVSPISFCDISMLVDKGRVLLDRATSTWAVDLLHPSRVEVAEITPRVAVVAAELPGFHGDPAERLLYATATTRRVPFVTKDGAIHGYVTGHPGVDVRW